MLKSMIFNVFFIVFVRGILADEICDFQLVSCPEEFNGQNIFVPKKVVSFSTNFHICEPQKVFEGTEGGKLPSIMFIIDQSTSTFSSDRNGVRYDVTRALLDTIYKKIPGAEVGVIVFAEKLYFDSKSDPNFVNLPANYPGNNVTQAYIPLLKLNSVVSGGLKAIDLIKKYIETNEISTSKTYKTIKYEPLFDVGGSTNINTAFDAAKYAMQKAVNVKENQYIIFISDGEANVDGGGKPANYFEKGIDVPTTFTVFLSKDGVTAPVSLVNMTNNIKDNNYSTNNKNSDIWSVKSSYDILLNMLLSKALNPILVSQQQIPTTIKVNGNTFTDYRPKDSCFYIPGGIKLNDSITNIKLNINYKITQDSSTIIKDTVVNIDFNVVRTDDVAQSEGILLNCRDTIIYNVSITATDPNAYESDNNNGTFEFSRNNASGDLTVYFQINGSAVNGTDYYNIADSIIFKNGELKSTLKIVPIKDDFEEGSESVVLKVISSKNGKDIRYNTSTQDSANVTIIDDFAPVIVTIVAIDSKGHEVDKDPAIIEFRRTKVQGDLTVYFNISGTAKNGDDYSLIGDSIVFKSGDFVSALRIIPVTDNIEEGDETVTVTIITSKSGYSIDYQTRSPDIATVTIFDKVIKDTIRVLITPNPFSFNEKNKQSEDLKSVVKKFQNAFQTNADGAILSIISSSPLSSEDQDKKLFGKVHIYDAIGNKVNKLDIKCIDEKDGLYGSLWDGTNFKNRRVGAGVYLVRMYYIDRHGKRCVYTSKIGIK